MARRLKFLLKAWYVIRFEEEAGADLDVQMSKLLLALQTAPTGLCYYTLCNQLETFSASKNDCSHISTDESTIAAALYAYPYC